MLKLEEVKLYILRYLNEPHVRQNINLEKIAIDQFFYEIKDSTFYITAWEELVANKHLDKTSPNGQWQIQPSGEIELNRLQNQFDLEKNIEASANLATATGNLKSKIDFNKWLTLLIGVGTFIVAWQQWNESKNSNRINSQLRDVEQKQLEQQIFQDSISRINRSVDTVFVQPDTFFVKTIPPPNPKKKSS